VRGDSPIHHPPLSGKSRASRAKSSSFYGFFTPIGNHNAR
jgi:hypothetical protein